MPRLVQELDDACGPLLDRAARPALGSGWSANTAIAMSIEPSRLTACSGRRTCLPSARTFWGNPRHVREQGVRRVRSSIGPRLHRAGTTPEQIREHVLEQPGVHRVLLGEERREVGLDHPRSGELVVLAEPDSWFAYPYWLDDRLAPDFARTVDIHRKPGYDPCELFFNPNLVWPRGRAIRRLIQKKLGFRTLFDVIPLDPGLVRGSHGLRAGMSQDKPILIADGEHRVTARSSP